MKRMFQTVSASLAVLVFTALTSSAQQVADGFQATNAATINYFMGKVGVGTNVPVSRLHIEGGGLRQSSEVIILSDSTSDNFGQESIVYPVTGQANSTWYGYAALNQSAGSFNSAFGFGALFISPGNGNNAMGYNALRQSAGGYNNAMGNRALYQSPGSYNSAAGFQALYGAPGSFNNAMGSDSLRQSTGSYNSAVGNASLYLSPGSYNNAVGSMALFLAPGSLNSAIGYSAGYRSGGTSNVFIGAKCAYTASGTTYYTNAIAIGAGAVPLGNNSMVLGNAGTEKTEIKGNVGIGTSTPAAKLDVVGSARFSQGITYLAALGDLSMGSFTNAP